MRGNRLRWGALGWVLTLQFFVVETLAQLRFPLPYSRAHEVISDLGAAVSPARQAMNASFVVQGGLILAGVALLLPGLRGAAARTAQALLAPAALGVVLVGVYPEDGNGTAHATGAVLHLACGNLGLLALAYALRRRSEPLGSVVALLGLVGTAGTVFFLAGVTEFLGRGGTERLSAYPVPLGLSVAAAGLLLLTRATGALPAEAPAGPNRRRLRAQQRNDRAERERERDAALEAAAAHGAAGHSTEGAAPATTVTGSTVTENAVAGNAVARSPVAGTTVAGHPPPEDGDPDDIDPENPWSAPPRRRRR